MVFGIGEDWIELVLDRQDYRPGDTMKGQLRLTLGKPKKARGLRVQFYGEATQGSGKHRHTRRVYGQTVRLGGEQEYPAGTATYDFEFRLPVLANTMSGGGVVGSVFNFLADSFSNTKWYVDASLDVPMALDINKKMRINLRR